MEWPNYHILRGAESHGSRARRLLALALLTGLPGNASGAEPEVEEAPEPDPIVRYSTFDRETDRAQVLARGLHDDEVVVIGGDEGYWRVYRTAPGAPRGVVVLAAPAGQPPDATSVRTVRTLLPRSGWSTLTLALPVAPRPSLPERDRPTRGDRGSVADEAASEESTSASDPEAAEQPSGKPMRAEPAPFDRSALDKLNAGKLAQHNGVVSARLRDAVADARSRANGQVVVVMASGVAATELAVAGSDVGADALVLVDLDVDGPGRDVLRRALAELSMPALILQHAPKRWRPEHGLGPRVEMHLLPARSEVRLARRVSGYLRRNYGAD